MIVIVPRRFSNKNFKTKIQKKKPWQRGITFTKQARCSSVMLFLLNSLMGANASSGVICIDPNTVKINKYDYKVTIFKILISLNHCETKTQVIL